MNIHTQAANDAKHKPIVWYKVPILWLMFALLGGTVISGIYMLVMSHDTNDSIVTESHLTPLSKKLALPENRSKDAQ